MHILFPVIMLLLTATAFAQQDPSPYTPLGQINEFLQLSASQLQRILSNNDEYNQFASEKQTRIWELQNEIAAETAKDNLDPLALGVRYVEIETSCRDMNSQAMVYQKKNTDILTDPQKARLKVLQDAMNLAPIIAEAFSGNLLGAPAYGLTSFTGNNSSIGIPIGTTTTTSSGSSGNGCSLWLPPFFPVNPVGATAIQDNRAPRKAIQRRSLSFGAGFGSVDRP